MKRFALASLPLVAVASTTSAAPQYESSAPIAYMTDLSSGAVLFEKNADREIPPASMAKMMTIYVAFDQIQKGKLKLDQPVEIQRATWEKWKGQGSTMFLMPNDKPTVKDLLHGIITIATPYCPTWVSGMVFLHHHGRRCCIVQFNDFVHD